jgi:type I restriction enzyme S subunit
MDSIISNVSSGKSRNEVSGISKLYGSTGVIGNTNDAPYSGKYILIARVGANAGFLTHIDSERFGATDNTLVLSVSSRAYTQFLFFYLSNVNLNLLVFGSGQPLITSSQLRNLTISVPAFKEQTKIAGVLSDLDLLIVQTECDLLSLRNHKQGLMQQLFPSLDELDAPIA